MTALTAPPENPGVSAAREVHRLQAAYRRRGWTVWHGRWTGQYWAAHTGRMILVCGDGVRDLVARIERVQPSGWSVPRPRR
ncbi:hypothetical protein AB0I72_20630 [Nocardiopsis sp. NPDC049922]|uniref:hypothetical protein n=1 Tax=Nocardiopsis sp. NPDC049922 TaxID=3155157 RepID=UPI0033E666DF